jgi:hypothetical protein
VHQFPCRAVPGTGRGCEDSGDHSAKATRKDTSDRGQDCHHTKTPQRGKAFAGVDADVDLIKPVSRASRWLLIPLVAHKDDRSADAGAAAHVQVQVQKAIVERVRPERDRNRLRTKSSVDSRASSDYGEVFMSPSSSSPEQVQLAPHDAASPGGVSTMSSSTHCDAAALSYNRVSSPASVST